MVVDFTQMTLDRTENLVRLSTPSYGCKNRSKYHTEWLWYWTDNQHTWILYGDEVSTEIQ